MNEKDVTRMSKFISLVLRHKPEIIGIQLDENGWVDVTELIEKSNTNATGIHLDFETLKHIVDTNSKKRFAFNDTFDKIRANQGHSVTIELGYSAQVPPSILYHGTSVKSLDSILQNGLEKRNRHHVHLSKDIETAISVGSRHGKPVVLEVLATEMHNANFEFFISENGVWLTDNVPARFLKSIENK